MVERRLGAIARGSLLSDYVILAQQISKKYRIKRGQELHPYVALRDVIASVGRRAISSVLRKSYGLARAPYHTAGSLPSGNEDFWALRDISFEVKSGDVIGIIGRNGAGKSTLLKILSRITEPTEGRATLRGRVASLLEVGTGFHPELTGRENIFLNGAILGMSKAEIKKKFDEIVAFAEVEQFLDTPVKRYSSGMYVRLAFAVAAHLEPEILVVDEVLSVGDVAFQTKCLGKMQDVGADGRTVLYVTHNLASMTNLCRRGILLHQGRLVEDTTAERATSVYLQQASSGATADPHVLFASPQLSGDEYSIVRVEMLDAHDRPKSILRPMEFVKFRIWYTVPGSCPQGSILLEVVSSEGVVALKLETNPAVIRPLHTPKGLHFADCCVKSLPLIDGRYTLGLGLAIYGVRLLTWVSHAAMLLISEPILGTGHHMSLDRKGLLVVEHSWETEEPVRC